ncbi:MAG: redox-regulated ATPase YchF [Candidatus Niyogibacteria bacterium]|nr:redox-regulated ATPase YchF [Candidatus Niyogibacteria bacterium]
MKIGIVGLPNVGKSTLFQALTKRQVDTSNYPFATIEPNVGVVAVPDERLTALAEMSKSEKVVPAIVEFVDIAGLVKGANKGEGLGNQFLANIREADAILEVVRAFPKSDVIHVEGSIDPQRDMEIIVIELALKDLETVVNHLPKAERELKGAGKEEQKVMEGKIAALKTLRAKLEEGVPAFKGTEEELAVAQSLNLLTAKPFMYLINADPASVNLADFPPNSVAVNIRDELDISVMSDAERRELGVESGLDKIIKKAYEVLGLLSYLTTGEKESRAWTIHKGATAKEAAGAIHSDFEKKFIRAEVANWQDLIKCGGLARAREQALVRSEGKEYIMRNGDVVEFKIGQ